MRKTILLFLCVCGLLIQTKAQTCEPTWTNYTDANSGIIGGGAIQGVAVDASGNKWFSTGGNGGISKFDGTTWTTYNSGWPNNNCYGIGVDNLNNVWFGISSAIVKFDGSTFTLYNNSNSGYSGGPELRGVTVDPANNNVWASTQSGLSMFNGSTWVTYTALNSGLANTGVMGTAIDATGKKWMATQGGGVSTFDGTTWTTYNTGNSGLPNDQVWAVGIHPLTGDKWFGTLGSGVCKFDGTTWTVYNTSNSGLIHNNVRALAFDADGRVYFGGAFGTTGVSVFDGTSWTNYTPSNSNLISGYIFDMATDAQGNVWIAGSSGNGASVIEPCPLAPPCSADTITVTEYICSNQLPYTWNGQIITAGGSAVDTLFLQNAAGCDSLLVLDLLVDQSSWTTYTDANSGINGATVQGLAFDASNQTWVAHGNAGVSVYNGSTWNHYTTTNSGLPHDNCGGMALDLSGNMWIGTYMNIAKFDGSTWTVYNSSNSGFPNTQEVRAITVDASNRLWAATQIGLAFFDGSTWSVYDPSNSAIASWGIMDVAVDASNKKWIGTQGGGVSVFDGATWVTYNTGNSGLGNNEVWAVEIDAAGNKWFGTWGNGVYKFDGTTWTNYTVANSGLVSNNVRSMGIDNQGNIWAGTNAGASVFNGSTWTNYTPSNSPLVSGFVYALAANNNGSVWMGGFSNNGVSVFASPCQTACTADTVTVTVSICPDDLPYTWNGHTINSTGTGVDSLLLQNAGGCDSLVVLDLLPQSSVWATYTSANGLVSDNVRSVAIDAAGNKWFGTSGGGISRFDGTTWTNYTNANSGINNYISDAAITAENSGSNVWFGTQGGGAYLYNGSTWTAYNSSNSGIANNIITGIAIDLTGNKWFGAYGAGVSKFDGTTWTTYNTSTGLASNIPECIAVDATNQIWVGYGTGSGASRFNGSTWTTYNTGNSGLLSNDVNGIAIAASGDVWFATGNGVSRYNGTTWTSYNSTNGLASNYVTDITISAGGNVWVTTAGGASMFDGTVWHAYTTANSGILANISTDVAIGGSPEEIWISHSGFGGASSFTQPCQPACTPTSGIDTHTACDSFTWIDGNTYNSSNNNATHVLVGGNVAGCDSTVTLHLTITASPQLSGNANLNGCDVVDLNDANISDANNTGASQLWFTSAAVPVFNPGNITTNGTYYVLAFSGTCADTFSVNVTVNDSPQLSAGGNLSGCDVVDLGNANISDANTTGATLAWFTNAAATVPVANPGNVTASATYYVTGSTGFCADTLAVNVTVNASPDLSAPAINGGCGTVNLNTINLTDANNTAATFAWYTNAAATLPVASPSSVSSAGTYYVVASAGACKDTLGVNINMSLGPQLSANDVDGCDVIDLDNVPVNDANNTGATLTWFTNAACTLPVTNQNISTAGVYYAVGSIGNCSDTVAVELHIGNSFTPSVTVETDNLSVCAGSNVIFSAVVVDGGLSPSYQWYRNGQPVGGNTAIYSNNTLSGSDEIHVVVTVTEACATLSNVESNHITLTVTPVSVPQISITVAPSNIFTPGQQVTFTALASAAGSTPTFIWYKNGTPIPGATATTYSSNSLQNGDIITCTVHSSAVCSNPENATSNSIQMQHVSGAGIDETNVSANVTVFPNPASDVVHVRIDSPKGYAHAVIRITDISGRVVLEQQRNIEAGDQQFSLEIFSLSNGLYQFQINAENQTISTQKIVVLK